MHYLTNVMFSLEDKCQKLHVDFGKLLVLILTVKF